MMNEKAERREYWSKHVSDWKASGETRSGYCRLHNLKAHQLTYWINAVEPTLLPAKKVSGRGFIAVQVREPGATTSGLTIRLSNGICLEGIHGGNLAVLRDLLGCLA